jgi:hypothetical protein
MSREYAAERIKEALKLSKGNATKARQLIVAWTNEDPRLLASLTRPHLTGIVAHAINRVITSGDNLTETPPAKPNALNTTPETFGREIMEALKGSATVFGHEGGVSQGRRVMASQRHIDALKRMAQKSPSAPHNPPRGRK